MTNKRKLGKTLFALAMMLGLMNIFTTPAQADEWHGHGGHDNGRHERYEREWHHGHQMYGRPVFVERPHVVYYYPQPVYYRPVYYAPPMIVQEPEVSSINLTFQLN